MRVSVKVSAEHSMTASTFEVIVPPGFDVGAHVHGEGEELFYVLAGELDLLAFEPEARTAGNWQAWTSSAGHRVRRCGPGSLLFVPPGCPHAFANPGPEPARMLCQFAPSGHERYFRELSEILSGDAAADQDAVLELRRRHGIEQLTALSTGASVGARH
jgi:oxalate decarboxylase/phosphoglucose isomerase-like protein (cupin superfamily)